MTTEAEKMPMVAARIVPVTMVTRARDPRRRPIQRYRVLKSCSEIPAFSTMMAMKTKSGMAIKVNSVTTLNARR